MDKDYNIGDLVWAKMKGYPFWPGKIAVPPSGTPPKKNCHYVFFYGSNNHGWVINDMIQRHSEELLEKYLNRKGPLFQKAILEIRRESKESESLECMETSEGTVSQAKESNADRGTGSAEESFQEIYSAAVECSGTARSEAKGTGNASLVRMLLEDNENEPSTSAGLPDAKRSSQSVRLHDSFFKENLDILPGIPETMSSTSSPPPTTTSPTSPPTTSPTSTTPPPTSPTSATLPQYDVVIPSPDMMNCPILPPKAQYIERPPSPPFNFCKSNALKEKNITPTGKKIGLVGLTHMAKGIIKNLAQSGHSVIIWNENPKESKVFSKKLKVKVASTPSSLIKAVDIIFSCAADVEAVRKFVFECLMGEIEHLKKKIRYVEMSSIAPSDSEGIATEINTKGGVYLEAQLCGSRKDASEGTLFISTAGDKMLYDDCKSCLDAISKKHMFTSPEIGTAIKLNVIHNMFTGTIYSAMAESFSLLESRNLGNFFVEILKKSELNSDEIINKATAMATKNFQTDTSVAEMQENFTLGLQLGHEVSHSTSVFAMANEAYKKAKMLNYADHDVSAVLEATKP